MAGIGFRNLQKVTDLKSRWSPIFTTLRVAACTGHGENAANGTSGSSALKGMEYFTDSLTDLFAVPVSQS